MRAGDPAAIVLSLLFGVFFVIGASYLAGDGSIGFIGTPMGLLGGATAAVGLGVLCSLVLLPAYRWADARWDAMPGERRTVSLRVALRRWGLPAAGIILVAWVPWLVVHFPGDIDSDTITQLLQWRGILTPTDHHPWFDTMVFGWFWDLGAAFGDLRIGLFVFLLLQQAATALGFGITIAYLGRLGVPAAFRLISAVTVAVLPVFAMSATIMSKDAFAGVFWLPFLVLVVESIRTRGRALRRAVYGVPAVALSMLLILSKRTNVYLVAICLVVVLVVAVRGRRLVVLGGGCAVILLAGFVWPALLPAFGVERATSTDMLSLPVQQTARIVAAHGDELSTEDREAIDAVLDYDGLADAYVPSRSDRVKERWNDDATLDEKLAYARTWLSLVLRYPGTALSATVANTFEYFAPVTTMNFQTALVIEPYIDGWAGSAPVADARERIQAIADELHEPAALDDARLAVNDATETFAAGNPLMSKALFASWIPLLLLVMAIRRRSGFHAIATIPLFVNLLFLIASPIALPRYIVPLLYGSVLAVGLVLTPVRWERRASSGERPDDSGRRATAIGIGRAAKNPSE